jgi:AraC-like DNA-binding protein
MKPKPQAGPDAEPEFFSAQVAKARRFYLNLQPPPKRLTVVCGGLEHCQPDYAIRRDTFPYFSLEYVAQGRGELRLKGKTHALQPGSIFAYGPGIPHAIQGDPASPLVKYFVDFAGLGAAALLRSTGMAPGQWSRVFPSHSLANLFDELIESGLQSRRQGLELCQCLLQCIALKANSSKAPTAATESLAFATYQQCRSHVEKHFLRLRFLQQIARECHVDESYLCRLFKRYHQQAPYQYLLRLKMNYAAARLSEPNTLVKQVAEEAGFADPFHFSRVFKGVLGLSPDAFSRIR